MIAWYAALSTLIQTTPPVTLITAHEYPSLMITFILTSLKRKKPVIKLEVTSQTLPDVQIQLSSSFLGSHYVYWLSGVHELEASDYKQFMSFISTYSGPHAVIIFLRADERSLLPSTVATITIPERITYDEVIQLLMLYDARLAQRAPTREILQQIFKHYQTISVEQAMLIMEYLPLLSKSVSEFIEQWLPGLITTEQSLFTLSQAFFSKDLSHCLHLWNHMRDQYVDQFWTAYWSEQLFRAYFVVRVLHTRDNTIDIKRLSARLPFSFIKRDYKRWTLEQLLQAHRQISQIELDLKAGASSWQLDAFYTKVITL